jgi:hypothetical protein
VIVPMLLRMGRPLHEDDALIREAVMAARPAAG